MFIDELETLRVGAGLRVSAVAKEANLSRDTLSRMQKHKKCSLESCISVVNAMNNLHYGKNGSKLEPDKLITKTSRFGGNE